jgi:hypothetical protein
MASTLRPVLSAVFVCYVQDPLFGSVQQRFSGQIFNTTALAYHTDPIFIKGRCAGGLVCCGPGLVLWTALVHSRQEHAVATSEEQSNPCAQPCVWTCECSFQPHPCAACAAAAAAAGHYLPETQPGRAAAEIIKFLRST